MKKRLKSILMGVSLTMVLSISALILLILYPQNLFANEVRYKTFNIYTNEELDPNFSKVLDDALVLVKTSELYDSNYEYDIFLSHQTFYNKLDTKLLGPALAKSIANNILLKVAVDVEQNLLKGAKNKRNLTRTIAHEMVHCLQLNRYGLLTFNPWHHPPMWKLEGYPEYVSYHREIKAEDYQLTESIKRLLAFESSPINRWIEIEEGQADPIVYYRSRLMVEYLIDIKGLTYDQILDENVEAQHVYAEMVQWYKTIINL